MTKCIYAGITHVNCASFLANNIGVGGGEQK